jgi:hypothetical protein
MCIITPTKMVDSCGNVLYWVLAEVANYVLSEATYMVCIKVAGEDNQEICNAIQTSMDFLGGLRSTGKRSVKLYRQLIEHTTERKTDKSQLYFVTRSLDFAYNISNTLEAYQKMEAIPWSSLEYNHEENTETYKGSVTISNVTSRAVTMQISRDGSTWEQVKFAAGTRKRINFWNESISQPYGFCKGDGFCDMQVYTNRKYKIKYNSMLNQYYLIMQ